MSGDYLDTIHLHAQAIWDVRRLLGWLRAEHGARTVGVYGISLGGYAAALLAGLERDLDCVIAGIPPVDYLRLLRSHLPAVMLRPLRGSWDALERLLRVISPPAVAPLIARERRYIYAAAADRLVPRDHARDLWLHWERPRITWYPGSHVSFGWQPEVRALLAEALLACGLMISPARAGSLAGGGLIAVMPVWCRRSVEMDLSPTAAPRRGN